MPNVFLNKIRPGWNGKCLFYFQEIYSFQARVNGERLMFWGNFLVFDMSKIVYWYAIGLHGGKCYGRKNTTQARVDGERL